MTWCTRASGATVQNKHPCISSCLWANIFKPKPKKKWPPFCHWHSIWNEILLKYVCKCLMDKVINIGSCLNTLRPWQNGRHFSDDIFKCIFLNENVWISNKISLKFLFNNNIPALVHQMAWHLPGDKPLSEPMLTQLLMHICSTRERSVNH